jgi:hypothetical protein
MDALRDLDRQSNNAVTRNVHNWRRRRLRGLLRRGKPDPDQGRSLQ